MARVDTARSAMKFIVGERALIVAKARSLRMSVRRCAHAAGGCCARECVAVSYEIGARVGCAGD